MTFDTSAPPNADSIDWTVPADAQIVTGQGTGSIEVKLGATAGQVCVSYTVGCATSAPACVDVSAVTPQPGQTSFSFTGSAQTFTVPACVTSLTVEAWGAQGGGSQCSPPPAQDDGGKGGYAIGTVSVTPGESLQINVGGKGLVAAGDNTPGGWGGGGPAGLYGGSGGGASDLRRGTALGDRLIVAGGGGGGDCGAPDHGMGGDGGGLQGAPGVVMNGSYTPGGGGTQTGGGAAGSNSTAGALGLGGGLGAYHEAGGGGGYYGGGGAYAAGGGGGSCYIAGASNASCQVGLRTGDGKVTLSW